LGERLVCNQEAIGSIPFTSTILRPKVKDAGNAVWSKAVLIYGARGIALPLFDNRFRMRCPKFFHALSSGQANKGARWMPWRQEAMKDVAGCDKLR
jgi:hypothetical protein